MCPADLSPVDVRESRHKLSERRPMRREASQWDNQKNLLMVLIECSGLQRFLTLQCQQLGAVPAAGWPFVIPLWGWPMVAAMCARRGAIHG